MKKLKRPLACLDAQKAYSRGFLLGRWVIAFP
jgi:hypothetical protein